MADLWQTKILTLWVDTRSLDTWHSRDSPARRGRRRTYVDSAILRCLLLREVYRLPLRATEGLARSLLGLLGSELPAPDYTTLSRRAREVRVGLGGSRDGKIAHLVIDSTGLKLYGEGEWKVPLHGKGKRRTWRKLHLLVDHRTQEALALSMTDKDAPDRREFPGLLGAVEGEVAEVLGDGAYDFRGCYRAIHARGRSLSRAPGKVGDDGDQLARANRLRHMCLEA